MLGYNNYFGCMSSWEERQRKMEQNKADVKRDRFDLFNDLGIESKDVIDGIGDCSKCFYKYDCHKKQNGYYCRHYLDCSEHDKKVWDSAIDEFAKMFISEGNKIKYLRHIWIEQTCNKIAEQLKEQNK